MPVTLSAEHEVPPLTTRTIAMWFGAYVLIGVLSYLVLYNAISVMMPVWLPAGIGFALQLRAAPRQRVWIFIGQALVEFSVDRVFGKNRILELHATYAVAVGLESYLAAIIATRLNGGRRLSLVNVGEMKAFLLGAVVATIAAGVLVSPVEVHFFKDTYHEAVLTWIQADLVAFLVVTPFALLETADMLGQLRGRVPHAVALLAALVVAVLLLFGREVEPHSPLVSLTFLLFPLLIWAAMAFAVVGAAAGSLLLSILIGLLTEQKLGPIAALGFDETTRQLIAQGFVGLLAISALALGVLTRHSSAMRAGLQRALTDAEEAAARFRSFFEGTPEMLAAVDREGRVVLANRLWMQEFSAFYNQANVIGLRVEALAAGAGAEAASTVAWWRRALAGEAIATPWSVLRGDGNTSAYEMSLAPLHDPAGRVVGAYMSVRDVADLRERQEAESRTRRLETVGRLAGGVAHDFNNIVTGMQGYTQLLADSLPEDHPGREDLEEIRKAGDRAAALTRQLLAYARRQLIEPRQVHVLDLLNGLAGLLRRVIGEGIALQMRAPFPGELWPVRADPGQLEQVIVNLAINARDAMPTGGRLTIECENIVVGGAASPERELAPGEYVSIAVTDSGEGMPPDVLERIFEPFFTTKPQGKGTGLGLATVDGIARQLGGGISAESTVGIGSTLRVFLPRDVGPVRQPPHVEPIVPTRPHGHEHVILVEDDDALRLLGKRVLEQCGFSVDAFADGEAALELDGATLARAAILVTDVVLPGMHGKDISDRLRARAPHLVVLYVSGYTEDTVSHHGVLDKGVNFLGKPFTPEALAAKVRALLDAAT